VVLKPPTEARRRQQYPCSANSCASTGHMHFSDGHVNTCMATRHFPAGHVAHSYTPIVQLGHLLMSIKGDVQGKGEGGTNVRAYEYTNARQRDRRGRAGPDSLSLSLSLSPSRSRPLATLVTPTTSTLVQDNTRLIPPPLVFHLAPTHLGRDTQRQIYSSVQGPPRVRNPDRTVYPSLITCLIKSFLMLSLSLEKQNVLF
jgi:hypothetical protein